MPNRPWSGCRDAYARKVTLGRHCAPIPAPFEAPHPTGQLGRRRRGRRAEGGGRRADFRLLASDLRSPTSDFRFLTLTPPIWPRIALRVSIVIPTNPSPGLSCRGAGGGA